MGWSTRLFVMLADDSIQRLAEAAFSRMLRPGSSCRAPDLAGERVRQASATVELADGVVLGLRHLSFTLLEFDERGLLDVARLNARQVSRVDAMWSESFSSHGAGGVVDAASRFTARGGTWQPDAPLRRRIEDAALGRLPCSRVRVIG